MSYILNQYNTKYNAELLFGITLKFFQDVHGYSIGDRGEIELLGSIMEHLTNQNRNNQSISLKDLNKQTLQMFRDIILQKLAEITKKPEIEKTPVEPPRFMASNVAPDPSKTMVDVNKAHEQLLKDRGIATVHVEPDFTVTASEEVIQPDPEALKEYKQERDDKITRDHYVVIDSRDRNHDTHSSNDYRIVLDQPLYNALTIEVISAEIPASQYLINTSNNQLRFQETNAQVAAEEYTTAEVAIGNYTISELKTAVESALSSASSTGANFTMDIATLSAQTKISLASDIGGSADLFNLLLNGGEESFGESTRSIYTPNSIGKLLGFKREDKTGQSSYNADYQYSLKGENYVLLKFKDIQNLEGVSDAVQDAFVKIPLDTHDDNVKYFNNYDYKVIKYLEPIRTRIDYFDVQFLTYNGDFYDFNGIEHSLTLKVTTLKHKHL
jgi:hypothetical protein